MLKRSRTASRAVIAWASARGKKGINKEYKICSLIFSVNVRGLKLRLLAFPGGPGGFRELREAGRNHFHLSWYLSVPGITSYDQKRSAANSRYFFFVEHFGG